MAGVTAQRWQRLAMLFDELAEDPAGVRAQRLAALALEDLALANELGALLASDDRAEGVLERTLGDLAPRLASAPDAPWETLAGTRIGAWRLIEPIGAGGMGEVWQVERIDGGYAQRAAIKLLKRGMDTQAILRRFLQERAILARLTHPNIVRLLDAGMSEDGRPYFVMDHVEGSPIGVYATAGRLGIRERVALVAQVADAVAYAHAQLVVHRDLKPSNILVDAAGMPHLLDFGIAKLLDASGEQTLTGTGVRVLSPAYAAPEQILGEPVGTATDVYALGTILYELLTGMLPHGRTCAIAQRLADGLDQETQDKASHVLAHRDSEAIRSEFGDGADRRQLARSLRGDLDLILAKALQRQPDRRYLTASALAAELRRWLAGQPIVARPDSTGYRVGRFVHRHRVGVAAGVLVVLSLLGGLGAAIWQAGVAHQQARNADRTRAFVVSMFDGLNPIRSRLGRQVTAEDLIRAGLERLDEELDAAPQARAELRVVLAHALFQINRDASALAALERGVEDIGLHYGESLNLAAAMGPLASAYKEVDREEDAERLAHAQLALYQNLPGDHRQAMIQVRTLLGNIATRAHRPAQALAIHQAILADRSALYGAEAVELAVDYNNLSTVHQMNDDAVEAEQAARRSLELLRASQDSPEARQVWALSAIATALVAQGRYDEAQVTLVEALALFDRTLGDGHSMAGLLLATRGRLAVLIGDFAAAESDYARANEILAQTQARQLGSHQARWGIALLEQGRDGEARLALATATAGITEHYGADTPPTLWVASCHALAMARLGEVAAGERQARKAVERMQALDFVESDDFVEAALCHADILRLAGREVEARQLRERAQAAFARVFGADHPRLPTLATWPQPAVRAAMR